MREQVRENEGFGGEFSRRGGRGAAGGARRARAGGGRLYLAPTDHRPLPARTRAKPQ